VKIGGEIVKVEEILAAEEDLAEKKEKQPAEIENKRNN
jgi:hypothetical protein